MRLPILSTTPPHGIVLDPLNGSGTSTLFARRHHMRGIGIDLNGGYCEQAIQRLATLASDEDSATVY